MSAYEVHGIPIRRLQYLRTETAVSIHGHCRFLPWTLSFPTVGTGVSCLGTVVSYAGN